MIIKTYTPTRRQAMLISKVGQRRQVVIPKEICEELGLHKGDFVEVTRDKSVVIITPKKLVDADEVLTSAQRATIYIDTRLAEGPEDVKAGRVYGPFDSVDAMLPSLHGKKSQRSTRP